MVHSRISYLYALPAVLLLVVFLVYPFLEVIRFSGNEWGGLGELKPVGLDNYRDILFGSGRADFMQSLRITLVFAVMTLVPFIGLSVGIALALHGQSYERVMKALLFLPGLVTLSGAAVAWYTLFSPDYGALENFLVKFSNIWEMHVPRWDQFQSWALVLVMLFTLWRHLGYGVLVVSARLKAIPVALTEAASVDGATPSQIFRHITLPLLKPAVTFLIVIGTVLSLQSYTAVFLLTRGGPSNGTEVLGYYLYKTVFESSRFGYGSALTVIILFLTLFFALAQARLLREEK